MNMRGMTAVPAAVVPWIVYIALATVQPIRAQSIPLNEDNIMGLRPNLSMTYAPQNANPMFHMVKQPLMIDCVRGFVIPTPRSTTAR
jgi:hypothetical protein